MRVLLARCAARMRNKALAGAFASWVEAVGPNGLCLPLVIIQCEPSRIVFLLVLLVGLFLRWSTFVFDVLACARFVCGGFNKIEYREFGTLSSCFPLPAST